jgi:4-nitrophenyl phosphatase
MSIEKLELSRFDGFIFDMDGVIYLNQEPITSAVQFINFLYDQGKSVLFLTNNSKYTRSFYCEKIRRMGIRLTCENDILTSSTATARYLCEAYPLKGKTAFLVGGEGLKQEISRTPLRILRGKRGRESDFVIVGWDTDLTFEKLKTACLAINRGSIFIATNDDATFPSPEGLWPGAGSIVAALERATGCKALVVGKPNRYMMEIALATLGSKRSRTLMVGDRLETDILGGKKVRVKTCLVLTGVTKKRDLKRSKIKPDIVVKNLLELS